MKRYRMEVVTQTLLVIADNESEAETKYAAYFDSDEECPCGIADCVCVEEDEEVFHSTDLDRCPEMCGTCGEYGRSDEGEFQLFSTHHLVFTCFECLNDSSNDSNANPDNHFTNPIKENK